MGDNSLDSERTARSVVCRQQGRRDNSRLDAYEAFIVGLIEASKAITLNVMVSRLLDGQGVRIGRSGLDVWLRKRAWAFKKDRTRIGAGTGRSHEAASGRIRRPV